MGKTKRIKERKTKNYRKTKKYRKTRRRLKQRVGGKTKNKNVKYIEKISINEIAKDIENLSEKEFGEKYGPKRMYQIFDAEYRNNCPKMDSDTVILKSLFEARNGKRVDYKVNLYNVVYFFLIESYKCNANADSLKMLIQHILVLGEEIKFPTNDFILKLSQKFEIPIPEKVNDVVATNKKPDNGYLEISNDAEPGDGYLEISDDAEPDEE